MKTKEYLELREYFNKLRDEGEINLRNFNNKIISRKEYLIKKIRITTLLTSTYKKLNLLKKIHTIENAPLNIGDEYFLKSKYAEFLSLSSKLKINGEFSIKIKNKTKNRVCVDLKIKKGTQIKNYDSRNKNIYYTIESNTNYNDVAKSDFVFSKTFNKENLIQILIDYNPGILRTMKINQVLKD